MSWTIGVDVGGTFTDFYAAHDETGIRTLGTSQLNGFQDRRIRPP